MNSLRSLVLAFLFLSSFSLSAQAEMADPMRANGKIYVVVAIIMIVLAGLIFYLLLLDKKVNKLEKMLREKQQQTK